MATLYPGSTKLIIDGIEVQYKSFDLEIATYDEAGKLFKNNQNNVKFTIDTEFGFIAGNIIDYRYDKDTVYLNGVFRTMMPHLFEDKELLDWQVAYLNEYGINHQRYNVWRNDSIFDTAQAYNFKRGYTYKKEV